MVVEICDPVPTAATEQGPLPRVTMGSKVEPRLSARTLRPLLSGLRVLGYDPRPILNAAGLSEAALENPDARLAMSTGLDLLSRAVEATGDPQLGLHLAEHADPGSFDIHLYAMLASPTLLAGYERICRFQRLLNDSSRVALELDRDRGTLRHSLAGGRPAPRQSVEFIVAAWVRAGRAATGTSWSPMEVRFAHQAPADVGEHIRFFGAPVRFATAENALVLTRTLLETACVGSDPSLLSVLDRHAADLLERAPRAATLADQTRGILGESLWSGEASEADVAKRLGRSVRTLRRDLGKEGTSYRDVLEQLRREAAMRHLSQNRLSVTEVAFLLGFSELSSFSRAFKRWTGSTPEEFRRERQAAR